MIERLRRMSYFFAYAAATIPLWHYIRDGRILALMVAVVTFAYIMVVLSSVQAAQPILSSEKAKIVLPRWLPDKPKYHKWWLLVRRTIKWHLLLAPPKMGLALGFMQKLHSGYFRVMPFSRLYSYNTLNLRYSHPALYPQLETIALALISIFLFAVAEAILISAIASHRKFKHDKIERYFFVIIIRLLFGLSMIGVIVSIQGLERVTIGFDCHCEPTSVYENGRPIYINEEHRAREIRVQNPNCFPKRIFETIYLTFSTSYDQSTLLSANVMRAWSQITYKEWIYGSSERADADDPMWDNRPFVARQILAGLLGLMLYAGATWVILWFVEDEVTT